MLLCLAEVLQLMLRPVVLLLHTLAIAIPENKMSL